MSPVGRFLVCALSLRTGNTWESLVCLKVLHPVVFSSVCVYLCMSSEVPGFFHEFVNAPMYTQIPVGLLVFERDSCACTAYMHCL